MVNERDVGDEYNHSLQALFSLPQCVKMGSITNNIASLVLFLLTTCSVVAQAPVQVEIEAVDVRNNSHPFLKRLP